jgi:hypothetical protein
MTATEAALHRRLEAMQESHAQELDNLRHALAGKDERIFALEQELKMARSEQQIHELEIRLLTGVLERDRLRVAAQQAVHAVQVGQAEMVHWHQASGV